MRALLIVGLAALVAGGGAVARTDSSERRPSTPTYYGNVKPILEARCTGCHMNGGIAPFPLTSYAAAKANRAAVSAAVRTRLMPPWHADRSVRRYLHDPSLTTGQIATIAAWARRGAPRGDARRPGRPLPKVAAGLSRVDLRLTMPEPYTPARSASHDDYRCFVLDWSPTRPTYVTGADIVPGVRAQVHHIIVYLAPPARAATVERWDAADPSPGYRCYGGPSATGERAPGINFLTGWAPGSGGGDFPPGTGQRLEPGSRLVLQVHYNLDSARPRPDRSTVQLALAPSVERRALYLPVVDPAWVLAPQSFRIPAGRARVRHSFAGDFAPLVRLLGGFEPARGVELHSVALHMHRLGRQAQLAVVRRAGRREVLLSIKRWDFDWQRDYRLAAPVVLEPGDRLAIDCTHANPTGRLVTWGEDSSDEMCIGFVYVAERNLTRR